MKLHEIEIFSSTPEKAKKFYGETLGMRFQTDNPGLKVYEPGIDGVDLNISEENSDNKIAISFLVSDVDAYVEMVREKGKKISDPFNSRLGMRSVMVTNYGGYQIILTLKRKLTTETILLSKPLKGLVHFLKVKVKSPRILRGLFIKDEFLKRNFSIKKAGTICTGSIILFSKFIQQSFLHIRNCGWR